MVVEFQRAFHNAGLFQNFIRAHTVQIPTENIPLSFSQFFDPLQKMLEIIRVDLILSAIGKTIQLGSGAEKLGLRPDIVALRLFIHQLCLFIFQLQLILFTLRQFLFRRQRTDGILILLILIVKECKKVIDFMIGRLRFLALIRFDLL